MVSPQTRSVEGIHRGGFMLHFTHFYDTTCTHHKGEVMETKIIQDIFIKDKSNETVKKEFTMAELKKLLAPTVMINLYYATSCPAYWFWQITEKKLTGEIWRKCQTDDKYEASNYGRVRDAKTHDILTQYESAVIKNTKKLKYKTPADIKKVIENNPRVSDIGYLCVDIKTKQGKKTSKPVYVMVADAWLKKDPNHPERNIVHHISNDGYDNCPYNLIYMSGPEHNPTKEGSVHYGKLTGIIPFNYRYPGPRNRLI